MAQLNADAINRILGTVDEKTKADILATGASDDELLEAIAWVNADDAMLDRGRSLPTGRVAQLVEILQPEDPLAEG